MNLTLGRITKLGKIKLNIWRSYQIKRKNIKVTKPAPNKQRTHSMHADNFFKIMQFKG